MNVSPLQSSSAPATAAFNAAAVRNATPAAQRTAVAAQFEAILVRQLLGKTMNSMLGGAEGGAASSVYGDMLADTMAQQLSAGPGLGLSRYIEQQLTPRGTPLPSSESSTAPATPVSST